MSKSLWSQLILIAGMALGGCASTPDFEPSTPVDETRTLEQGLRLCSEYEPPAGALRRTALEPVLDCLDELDERFPGAASAEQRLLRAELGRQHELVRPEQLRQGAAREILVGARAAMKALWRPLPRDRDGYSSAEKAAILRWLPRTAGVLGAREWRASASAEIAHPEIESLRAGLRSLQAGSPPRRGTDESASEPCRRWVNLLEETEFLADLMREPRQPDAESEARVTRQLQRTREKLETLDRQVNDRLAC